MQSFYLSTVSFKSWKTDSKAISHKECTGIPTFVSCSNLNSYNHFGGEVDGILMYSSVKR